MAPHVPAHLSGWSAPVPTPAPAPVRRRRRKLLLVPLATGVALASGLAFAAWTSDGTGTGEAKSTTSVNSVIAPGTSAADLYPGASGTVTVTVSNPNPYPVLVTSISAGSSNLVNTSCTAGTVTTDTRALDVAGLDKTGGGKTIAASGSGTFTLTTHMSGSAVDACKSQTFTLPLTATLISDA